jgi:3-carboxy-cis,cis-muconate cycloisomerase
MTLFDSLFGATAVNEIFTPAGTVQRMLDFEAALADAESEAGVIPARAAGPIRAHSRAELFDLAALATAGSRAGNIAIPMVQQLTALVDAADPDAGRYVHWGATSQDVIDTALVLQVRDAACLIEGNLTQLRAAASRLADRHRTTPVVARTWMQHAVPTSFGLQVAGWVDALDRHATRLAEIRRSDLVLQFGGAGGTLAALAGRGIEVGVILARRLDLPMPAHAWHAHRDRIATVAATLGVLVGTLGKIARDMALQSQTEVAELAEPAEAGRGTSSTMPHKRNPVAAAIALAAAVRVPALVSSVLTGMVQEHERGLGGWQAEWETVPEVVRLTAGALHHLMRAVEGLTVDPTRMRANLEATAGLVYSESVVVALAPRIGRRDATALVDAASREAIAARRHLRDVLAADPKVQRHMTPTELGALFDPGQHLAAAAPLIERALHSAHETKSSDANR